MWDDESAVAVVSFDRVLDWTGRRRNPKKTTIDDKGKERCGKCETLTTGSEFEKHKCNLL